MGALAGLVLVVTALLEVTEGGWPSALVIGDDNSPFHSRPAWPLG